MPDGAGRVQARGVAVAYETFGEPDDVPLVLAMGLGAQMIEWPDSFCRDLAGRGRFVVRFDNRDAGLSTHLEDVPAPSAWDLVRRRRPPYDLHDMAADVVGLLDGLGLDRVHLVGASMGGQVCQVLALDRPERVRTLTLMMTSPGSHRVGNPKPQLLPRLLRPPEVRSPEQAEEAMLELFGRIGSPSYRLDEERLRDVARRGWERGYDPAGFRRQLAAAAAQQDRTKALSRLAIPTLVMHGLHDPLVDVSGGLALARAVPCSTFVGFAGMGHDLPRELLHVFADHIGAHTAGR